MLHSKRIDIRTAESRKLLDRRHRRHRRDNFHIDFPIYDSFIYEKRPIISLINNLIGFGMIGLILIMIIIARPKTTGD